MSLWVPDTDTLTLWLRGQETVAARVATTPPQQRAVTIITIEEVLGGWYTQVRRARDDQQCEDVSEQRPSRHPTGHAGAAQRDALAHRNLLRGRETLPRDGRVRSAWMARVASSYDPLYSGALLSGAGVPQVKKKPQA